MPFGYGVGDHRAFIVDIPIESLVGINPVKIVRPAGRRLNSKLPGCCKAYIDSLESNVIKHKLLKRLHTAYTGTYSDLEQAEQYQQGRKDVHATRRENMPKNKVLQNTLLSRIGIMDPLGSGVPIAHQVS